MFEPRRPQKRQRRDPLGALSDFWHRASAAGLCRGGVARTRSRHSLRGRGFRPAPGLRGPPSKTRKTLITIGLLGLAFRFRRYDNQSGNNGFSNRYRPGRTDSPEARRYNRIRRWLGIADFLLGLALMVALLATGWSGALRDIAYEATFQHYGLALFLYLLMIMVAGQSAGAGPGLLQFSPRTPLSTFQHAVARLVVGRGQRLSGWPGSGRRSWPSCCTSSCARRRSTGG